MSATLTDSTIRFIGRTHDQPNPPNQGRLLDALRIRLIERLTFFDGVEDYCSEPTRARWRPTPAEEDQSNAVRGAMVTGIVVALGFIMIAVHFVTGRRAFANKGGGSSDNKLLSDTSPAGTAFLGGFVAVAALVQIGASGRVDFESAAAVGFFVAVVALLLAQFGKITAVDAGVNLFYSLLGLIALIPAMSSLTESSICGVEVNVPLRVTAVVLFLALAVLSGASGFLIAQRRISLVSSVGLGWFGAVDIVLFLTSPVGVMGGPGPAVLGIGAAVVLGAVIGVAPELGLLVAGVGLALIVLLTSATGATLDCQAVDSIGSVTAFVTYAVLFCALRFLTIKVFGKRGS